ncbi:MAG: rRNA maturation RNase YbeY [Gemmatimonadaceae bacterium]|nr:rRNA maturation RNase YbeY [Gemmatimonadaceae bacterium]
MSRAVDVALDGVRIPVSRARVADVATAVLKAEKVAHALLSIAFVSRERIAALNREHLGHIGATDVISFAFVRATDTDPVIGDIYICADVARAAAKERRIGVRDELTRLVIHGTLHVLGYDHPDAEGREQSPMWKRQEQLLARVSR